jgi:pimeloyl-ACP methyl ester carboxylesterase
VRGTENFRTKPGALRYDASMFEYRLLGSEQGETIVFLHGWPDDSRLWEPMCARLAIHYRCVLVTLPGYSPGPGPDGHPDYSALITGLADLITRVQAGRDPSGVTLIAHDFGALLAYLLEDRHPALIRRIVALDIGGNASLSGLKKLTLVLGYQGWLILAWLLRDAWPALADGMTRAMARLVRAPRPADARARMNYLYYYLWRDRPLKPGYRPRCPVLYLYGSGKPFQFHSPQWIEQLRSRPDSGVKAVEGAGHWFLLTRQAETEAAVEAWLRARA